jgi:excisionase family DNA binding protein
VQIGRVCAVCTFVILTYSKYPDAVGDGIMHGGMNMARKNEVPIWEKSNLTLDEAAQYFGIGINKLRDMSNEKDCSYVLWVGGRRLIKRAKLQEYLDRMFSV